MQKQLNFNLEENQDRCIYRDHPPFEENHIYGGLPLSYFIYNRNYGWCRYKGFLYNLNKHEQSEAFIQVLKNEGFLIQEDDRYTINDDHFIHFTRIHRYALLFFLYYAKAEPLSEQECIDMDKQITQK